MNPSSKVCTKIKGLIKGNLRDSPSERDFPLAYLSSKVCMKTKGSDKDSLRLYTQSPRRKDHHAMRKSRPPEETPRQELQSAPPQFEEGGQATVTQGGELQAMI